MLAHEQNEKSLRRDIYALRRALRKDIKEIKSASKSLETIPTYAIPKMQKVEREMRSKSVRKQDLKELQSTYRQLKYIRGLKSSTLEGAIETAGKFEPIAEHLRAYSPSKREEFWDIYGELYKHNSTMERYKYELFDYIDTAFQSQSPEEILLNLINTYTEIVEGDLGRRSDAEISILFSDTLSTLLQELK